MTGLTKHLKMGPQKRILKQLNEVDWDFAGYNPNGRGTGIHNIHWYPAPFPPGVAGTLIDILGVDTQSFLDPFCGSSVAPFEAWFSGKKVFAIDNNHFAIEIAKAKAQFINAGSEETANALADHYQRFRDSQIRSFSKTAAENICKRSGIHVDAARWFTQPVLAEIAVAKQWILSKQKLTKEWRSALSVTLSALLHGRFSIARNYHYTYIVDNSRVKNEALGSVDVQGLFVTKLYDNMIQGQLVRERLLRMGNLYLGPDPEFIWGRAQNLLEVIPQGVDFVLTSPPYFGMNDYVRSQYLTWLIFQWRDYEFDLAHESGSRRSRNSRTALGSYFSDMYESFLSIHRILKKGGYLALIFGSSTTKLAREIDPLVEMEKQLNEIGFERIWEGRRRIRFRKINNTPFRDEVIWIYQR